MTDDNLITFTDVCFGYAADDTASDLLFENLNLTIARGKTTAILGTNGSGKSTLARLMNGLLLPNSGKVCVDGLFTSDSAKIIDLRSKIGMVFQNPDNQIVESTVEDDIAFGPSNLGLSHQEIDKRVDNAIVKCGLQNLRKRGVHELSGGQKQKLAVASCLAMQPLCIVMDEATAMLDPSSRNDVLSLIASMKKEYAMTVVNITHEMPEAFTADYVYVVHNGKIVIKGKPEEVFLRVAEMQAYGLEVPSFVELLVSFAKKYNLPLEPHNIANFASAKSYLLEILHAASVSQEAFATLELKTSGAATSSNYATDNACKNTATFCTDTKEAFYTEADTEIRLTESDKDKDNTKASTADAANSDYYIVTKNLSHDYFTLELKKVHAIQEVNFSLPRGQFVVILGPTGSGKSTLVQHFNGLLRPTSGSVAIMGKELEKVENIRRVRRHIGLLFQYAEDQLFAETVEEDIAFAPRQFGYSEEETKKLVRAAAKFTGVSEILPKSPFELSGGQQRRVALAGVLASDPEILVLDEPCAGLDPRGRETLMQDLKLLCRRGKSVVMISHDMETAARFADRILVMGEGRILLDAAPSLLFTNQDLLQELHLAMPVMTEFIKFLKPEISFPENIFHTSEVLAYLDAIYNRQKQSSFNHGNKAEVDGENTARALPKTHIPVRSYDFNLPDQRGGEENHGQ